MLDEAFSSIDSETEEKIIENIKSALKDATIIVVSHRLSTVKKMDLVYFLKSPSVMEVGTHEQLLAKCPKYGELFASQLTENQKTVISFGGHNG
jgi:ATP-binding cassette subfamily B protein